MTPANRRILRDYCTAQMRVRPSLWLRFRWWLQGLI